MSCLLVRTCRRWMPGTLIIVLFGCLAPAPAASAMTFLVQRLGCSEPSECSPANWLRGSTSSRELAAIEFGEEFGFPDEAALSPDGTQIAWTEFSGGLNLSDTEGRPISQLVHYEDPEHIGMTWRYEDPVFSPATDAVFFNWFAECFQESCEPFQTTPREEPHVVGIGGGTPIGFSTWPGSQEDLALSSDGGRFAFVGFVEGERAILLMDTSGHDPTRVTTTEMGFSGVAHPSFAPEGNRITFEATPSGREEPQIYLVDINGGGLVQLTRSGGAKPQWSPDESFIAYTEPRNEAIDRVDPETGRSLSPLATAPEASEKLYRVVLPQADMLRYVRTFEPVPRFDSSEQWRPLNVDRFLAEGDHLICDRECDREPITSAADLERHATDTSYIDIAGELGEGTESYHSPEGSCLREELLDCDSGPNSAIYYRVTRPFFGEAEIGYRYIDYWFFYRANTFVEEIEFHEGDWEGVTIAPSPGNPETFDYAAFSQHRHFYAYLRDVLRCDERPEAREPPGADTCGREESRTGQRVSVMVAHGDHANYTTPCSETIVLVSCHQNSGGEFSRERGYDGARRWGKRVRRPLYNASSAAAGRTGL